MKAIKWVTVSVTIYDHHFNQVITMSDSGSLLARTNFFYEQSIKSIDHLIGCLIVWLNGHGKQADQETPVTPLNYLLTVTG